LAHAPETLASLFAAHSKQSADCRSTLGLATIFNSIVDPAISSQERKRPWRASIIERPINGRQYVASVSPVLIAASAKSSFDTKQPNKCIDERGVQQSWETTPQTNNPRSGCEAKELRLIN
jgi:hypothetical protein